MSGGPWQPLVRVVLQALLVWVAAAVVDLGGLTPEGQWPYLFAAAGLTVSWASWGIVATMATGLVAWLANDPSVERGAVWSGAVVAAAFGLLGLGGSIRWLSGSTYAADAVMALALLCGGVLSALPLVGLVRARRTD